MKAERNGNIELLRIIAMASVIGHHFLKWGGVLDTCRFGSVEYIIYWLINALFFTCVNCFMLITGYFMSEKRMRPSRLVKLWIQVLTYSVICTITVMLLNHHFSIITAAKALVPLTSEQYWFATHYALTLCFIPLLNPLVNSITKDQYRIGLVILFIVFSVMPTFLVWERDLITSGRDFPWMIVLYLTGSYIRRFGLNLGKKQSFIGFVICVMITGLVRTPLGILSQRLIGRDVLAGLFFRYNSVTVFLGAVLLFNALRQQERIKIERPVLKLAPLSFAVYLIHDNPNVRDILWKALPLETIMKSGILPTLAALIAVVVIIFLAGCLLERLRLLVHDICHTEKLYQVVDSMWFRIKERVVSGE